MRIALPTLIVRIYLHRIFKMYDFAFRATESNRDYIETDVTLPVDFVDELIRGFSNEFYFPGRDE